MAHIDATSMAIEGNLFFALDTLNDQAPGPRLEAELTSRLSRVLMVSFDLILGVHVLGRHSAGREGQHARIGMTASI
jgi:hypothetical protein